MMTSRTMLCLYHVLQHARKLTCHELTVASMQHIIREGNSLAFRKQKLKFDGNWCNGKGIPSAYFQYNSDFSKCRRSLFARYRAPSTFKFCRMLQ